MVLVYSAAYLLLELTSLRILAPKPSPCAEHSTHTLCHKFYSCASTLVRLCRCKGSNQRRVPHIQHLLVTRRIRMDAIAQVAVLEARILIHNPNRRLCLVQTSGPRRDLCVKLLDLGIVATDSQWNDLRDLDISQLNIFVASRHFQKLTTIFIFAL